LKAVFRRALELLTLGLLAQQLALAIVASVLFIVWLHIPDAGAFQILLTLLLAIFLATVVFGGEALILLRLRPLPNRPRRLLLGAIALLLASLLSIAWSLLLAYLSRHNAVWAGYLNSRLPASNRVFFSYLRLTRWLEWLRCGLQWIANGMVLATALAVLIGSRGLRSSLRLIGSPVYWLMLAFTAFAGTSLTRTLINWTPGHGLPVEMTSLILRLGTAVIIDLLLLCTFATISAALLEREQPLSL
jgi:hypothetical protein